MTSQTRTLPPDIVSAIVSEAALSDDAKVQTLATAIAFEDDGPLAQRLMSVPMPENDLCTWSEIQAGVAQRRALLQGTEEWHAAERLLAEARPA